MVVLVPTLRQQADKFGVSSIGGFTPTVGATGGYIIGGGTGPLSNQWGLGVDSKSIQSPFNYEPT